jgi:hypoxia up-regulated 1
MSLLPLFVLLLFSTSASAASAVLGIDLGTEYLKAALVKPGTPLEIVLTKDSKRKEAATIAFKPSRAQTTDPEAFPERLFGGDAVALAARFPEDVYPNLKSLLGVPTEGAITKEYSSRFPGLALENIARDGEAQGKGTVAFKSKTFGNEQEPFMVEELLAMEFQNLKANAEVTMPKGSVVTDAVITFPAFYTVEEKRAVELATDLAGLRLLGLISDGLAVGLNYATGRTFESVSEGAKPEYHLVYDMGAGSTTATVLKFQGRTVKDGAKRNKTIQEVQVLGTGWDNTLGGDTLNQLIVDDMITKFLERPRIKQFGLERVHVKTHAKTMARFWKDAERLRQVLSANSQTSASFEGLYYEDVSFSYKLSRTEFEELVGEHSSRVTAPLVAALDSAGVTLAELESIILHGGAVRTPFVQKQLEIVAGGSSKIKTNVNADEAAVLGAAFKAAGLSSSFRVKEIRAGDTPGFAFGLKWTADGKERQQKLFTPTSQIGAGKQVPIKLLEDFRLQFTQALGEIDVPITEVDVTNLTASVARLKDKYGCAPTNISTMFTIRLSPVDGLPEVSAGSVSCETQGSTEGDFMDNVKGLFGFGSKKAADKEPFGADADEDFLEDATTMTPLPLDDPTSSGSTISSTSPSSSTSTKSAAKPATPTPTTISIPLAFTTTPQGLNKPPTSQLLRIRTRLAAFAASDRASALRSEALNTLEGFTYRARDYLSDSSFIAVSSEKVREQLEQKLNAVSEWLYGEGVDANLKDFQDKLKELKAVVDPVLARKDETGKRDNAVKSLKDQLEQMASMIKMVERSISTAAEEAASAASSAISAGVESASSVAESMAESVTGTPDNGDDLDDDPYSTSSTSSGKAKLSASPDPAFAQPIYTAEDLTPLQKSYDSVKAWLDEKLALQEKLTPYDDPAVLVKDLDLRAKQLQTDVTNLIMKNVRGMPGGGGGSGKKPKSSSVKKSKTKKTKSNGASSTVAAEDGQSTRTKKTKSSGASSTATAEDGQSARTGTAGATQRRKDEL